MKKNSKNTVRGGMALLFGLITCCACTDSWDDHYSTNTGVTSTQTLWAHIEADPNLSNFAQVLKATKVYSNHKVTNQSYADLLGGDQSFTVWAPVISDHVRDSLLQLCQTAAGDSAVEKAFIKNHVARYTHPVGSTTDEEVTLFNRKMEKLTYNTIGGVSMTDRNLAATNGVLHVVNGPIPFFRNIYEYITNEADLSQIGSYISSFQKDSLDEKVSVKGDYNEDGQQVYVDSVMIENNPLLNDIGFIGREDSIYWMIAPTNAAWNTVYAQVEPYYNYAFLDNADSLQRSHTKYAIAEDLIFNARQQRSPNDSLTANKYSTDNLGRHVFYNPYGTDGIMTKVRQPGIECSNGLVYRADTWPFDPLETFFQPIKVEAERESNISAYSLCTFSVRMAMGDSISRGTYLDVVPLNSAANPTITFDIPNTLSGKYDVCVVCLPKTVYDANTTDFRPCQFRATLTYADATGASKTFACGNTSFNNDPYRVDTVCVAENFAFPTCNYGQDDVTVKLMLRSFISSSQTAFYNREMYIDCIYLKPRKD